MNKFFDRDEMLRLTREGMENSMRFFMTMNENILKFNDIHRETINETTRKNLEMVNKACEEYQRNNRLIVTGIETMWNKVMEQITPKTKTADHS